MKESYDTGSLSRIGRDKICPVVRVLIGILLLVPAAIAAGPPSILPGGIVPLYGTAPVIQPGSWVSIYGANLIAGTVPESWAGDYPTTLGGTMVTINGKYAYLSYASPGLINLQAPDDPARGPVKVTVTTSAGSTSATVTLADQSPSFSLLGDGKHVAGIIVRPDGSGSNGTGANSYDILGPAGTALGYKTVSAKAGDVVVLFGQASERPVPYCPRDNRTAARPRRRLPRSSSASTAAL